MGTLQPGRGSGGGGGGGSTTNTSGECYERPAAATAGALAEFLDVSSGAVDVSTGDATRGWRTKRSYGSGPDKARLAWNSERANASGLDLSPFAVDAITFAMLFWWSGTSTGAYNTLFSFGAPDASTGLNFYVKESGGNLLLQALQSGGETTLKTYTPASALTAGLHAFAVTIVNSSGHKARHSEDGAASADVALAASYATPSATASILSIGRDAPSNNPSSAGLVDLAVWSSALSGAQLAALSTRPATETWRLPIVAGMGAPRIRVEARRYDPLTPLLLSAQGIPPALTVGSAVRQIATP